MKQTLKELKYASYLTRHPFKGFWDIKYEKYGSLKTAIIILLMTIITQVLSDLYTGYLFNGPRSAHYNFLDTLFSTLALYLAWCIANWCLTCLSDGKGTFMDICIATAYSLLPFVVIQIPMIVLSNMFVLREVVFYDLLNGLSYVWVAFLIIISQVVTHHFTLSRTMVVILFTIVGIIALATLVLLFFNLIQQVLVFVSIVIEELVLRLSY